MNNNTIDNIQILFPVLFKVTKTKKVNWTVSFSEKHFRSITNVLEGTSVAEFVSEQRVFIRNNSATMINISLASVESTGS